MDNRIEISSELIEPLYNQIKISTHKDNSVTCRNIGLSAGIIKRNMYYALNPAGAENEALNNIFLALSDNINSSMYLNTLQHVENRNIFSFNLYDNDKFIYDILPYYYNDTFNYIYDEFPDYMLDNEGNVKKEYSQISKKLVLCISYLENNTGHLRLANIYMHDSNPYSITLTLPSYPGFIYLLDIFNKEGNIMPKELDNYKFRLFCNGGLTLFNYIKIDMLYDSINNLLYDFGRVYIFSDNYSSSLISDRYLHSTYKSVSTSNGIVYLTTPDNIAVLRNNLNTNQTIVSISDYQLCTEQKVNIDGVLFIINFGDLQLTSITDKYRFDLEIHKAFDYPIFIALYPNYSNGDLKWIATISIQIVITNIKTI